MDRAERRSIHRALRRRGVRGCNRARLAPALLFELGASFADTVWQWWRAPAPVEGLERRLRLVKSVMVNYTTVLQATATSMTAAGPFPAEADNPREISGWESALGMSEKIRFCLCPGGPH